MRAVVCLRVAIGVDGVEQGFGQHPGIALPVGIEHAQRHDAGARCGHSDEPGDVRAVAIGDVAGAAHLRRVVVVVDEVEARQQASSERWVRAVDAGIEHSDAHACASGQRLRFAQADGLRCPLRREGLRCADCPGHIASRFRVALDRVDLGNDHVGLERHRRDLVLGLRTADDLEPIDRARAEAADQAELVLLHQRRERIIAAQHQQHFARDFVATAAARAAAATGVDSTLTEHRQRQCRCGDTAGARER